MVVERSSMAIARVYKQIRALVVGTPLLLSLLLSGCATSTAGSSLMDAHAEAPMPPKTSAYLPVEDLPPPRENPAMTLDERSKLKNELIAARDRQAAAAKAQGAEPAKPQ
jgi:hypothetical protein